MTKQKEIFTDSTAISSNGVLSEVKGGAFPILFSTPMIQAILKGHKKMTRRVAKFNWLKDDNYKYWKLSGGLYDAALDEGEWGTIQDFESEDGKWMNMAKYHSMVGDILWVRETFTKTEAGNYLYKADLPTLAGGIKWKPSIFMPKEACRIWLKITDIKIEKLKDISEADAFDEGVQDLNGEQASPGWGLCQARFKQLWVKINGAESWNQNPYVWVVSFERAVRPL